MWCPCPEWDPLFKKRKALFLPLQSLSHTSHCSFGSSCRPLGRRGNLFQIKKRPLSFSAFYLALCASATLTSLQFQKHNKYAFGMSQQLLIVTDRCSYQLATPLTSSPPQVSVQVLPLKGFRTSLIKQCLLPSIPSSVLCFFTACNTKTGSGEYLLTQYLSQN